jgi:hypothetical protein
MIHLHVELISVKQLTTLIISLTRPTFSKVSPHNNHKHNSLDIYSTDIPSIFSKC